MNRLGIIDWGIGGISIYKLLKEKRPNIAVTYLSDTGATPYGKMTRRELITRLDHVIHFLKLRGVTHIVIGCNAASTAIPFLREHKIPIEGVIEPAVALTLRSKPSSLGVIGGRRTILSGVYRRAFAKSGIEVRQRIAQPLSGLIESGDINSPALQTAVKDILTPLRRSSHILLACTHYPAITTVLRQYVSPKTKFIDPASEVVGRIDRLRLESDDDDQFLTTGDTATMKASARNAFAVTIENALRVRL